MVLLCIGLMSGTSLDGVDGVLAQVPGPDGHVARVRAHAHSPFPAALRQELLDLNRSGPDELHRGALAANALVECYAEVVARLLEGTGVGADQVSVIGAHGQTVRHRPGEFDGIGYTLQLINGALLSERTGIDTACDFRSADVAGGGQGAPLVPAFHAAAFSRPDRDVAVLNIGGIANLTLLPASGSVSGFDCGPGNMLLDLWCSQHRGQPFDAGGAWAAGGQVIERLLNRLSAEPYFGRRPPKSTGRDLFSAEWLQQHLDSAGGTEWRPVDVMATLAELTARAAADALQSQLPDCSELLVCGGGAFNGDLMRRLAARLPGVDLGTTDRAGMPPDQVEALAFAWLGACRVRRLCANLRAVTGARGPRVLGALYAAPRARD